MPIDPSIAANTGYRPPPPVDWGQMAQQREAVRNAMLQGQLRANQIQDRNNFTQVVTSEGFDPTDPETQRQLAMTPDGREFLSSMNTGQTFANSRDAGQRETTRYTQEQVSRHIPGDADPTHLQQAQEQILSIRGVDAALVNDYFERLRNEPDPVRRLQLMHQLANEDPQVRAAIGASLPDPVQINQGNRIALVDKNPQSATYGQTLQTYDVQLSPGQQISLGQSASRQDFEEGVGRPPGFNPVGPAPRNVAPTPRPGVRTPQGGHRTLPPGFRPVPGT